MTIGRVDQANYDLLYDKDYYSKSLHVDHFIDKPLTFRTIEDGYVLPFCTKNEGGIFDSEGNYVKGSSFREGLAFTNEADDNSGTPLAEIAGAQGLNVSAAEHRHTTVVYLGNMLKVWGHFISDDMRLMWFLRSKEYREQFSECPIVYMPINGFQFKGDYKRMMEILGVNTSLLTPITSLTKFDRIVLPDECFFKTNDGTRYFTQEYVGVIDCVRDFAIAHAHPGHAKKIYFSHSKYVGHRVYGEDKLEKYFAAKGYEIIYYPERLGFDEELNALVNCESFASTVGSCSHNSVFLRDNTEVILIPRANYLTGYQVAVDQVHQQNIHYIDSSFSIFAGKNPWGGPFLYFISSNLRKYFNDSDTESIVSFSDFWKYLRESFGFKWSSKLGKYAPADNPKVFRYYSTIAAEYFSKLVQMSWPSRLRKWISTNIIHRNQPTQ